MTPKAERTLGKARKVGDEVALEALNGFSDEEAKQLIALAAAGARQSEPDGGSLTAQCSRDCANASSRSSV